MASAANVVTHRGGGYEIQLTGDICQRVEPAILQGCANAIVACVEKNHLKEGKFAFTGECLSTITEHIAKTDCVNQGFGLNPAVSITSDPKALSIHLSGEIASRIAAKVLEACVNAIAECVDNNHPLDKRFSLNDKCLATLAKHDTDTKCVSKAFGLMNAK